MEIKGVKMKVRAQEMPIKQTIIYKPKLSQDRNAALLFGDGVARKLSQSLRHTPKSISWRPATRHIQQNRCYHIYIVASIQRQRPRGPGHSKT